MPLPAGQLPQEHPGGQDVLCGLGPCFLSFSAPATVKTALYLNRKGRVACMHPPTPSSAEDREPYAIAKACCEPTRGITHRAA